jgi:hypothetical protein
VKGGAEGVLGLSREVHEVEDVLVFINELQGVSV